MFNEQPRTPEKTNLEVVTEFMEWGSALNQAFVIEALTRYAKQITSNPDEVRKAMANSPLHPESWIKCASDWMEIARTKYGEK
jgi:hypothetical protein